MRKTSREIARLMAAEKQITPGAVATLKLVALGTDKALKFGATMKVGASTYEVAGDNGKVKTFSDVDGFLKFAAKAAEVGNGVYTVEVDTGALLASTVPSDIKAWAQSQVIRLGKVKIAQNAVIAGIDEELTLMVGWEAGNAAQQAKKAETQNQRACVVADVSAIDAEVVRLNAIIAG